MAATAQFIQFGPYYNSGALVTGVKVYHYLPGTTTLKNVWTDRAKTSVAAQPLVGDANGIASCYADGLYKFVIKDSADVTLYTFDNVAVRDELGLVYRVEDYADFATAVSTIGTTTAILRISETQTVSTNVTVPANLRLWFVSPAQLSINASRTVTVWSPDQIMAEPTQQIVTGSGTLAFTIGGTLYPGWWGAKGDVKTVTDAAITASQTTLTSATANFSSTDVGKAVIVKRAGAQLSTPAAPMVAQITTGTGNLANGDYNYKLVACTTFGQSLPSTASSNVTVDATHKQVRITIPAVSGNIVRWMIYRSAVGPAGDYQLIGVVEGGGTTFDDNTADSRRGAVAPTSNTSAMDLITTIAAFTNGTTVTVTDAASTTVTGATCHYGTNSSAAMQAAWAACAAKSHLHIPAGSYWLHHTGTDTIFCELTADDITVSGVGRATTLYFPTWGVHDHTAHSYGLLNVNLSRTSTGCLLRDFRLVSEYPSTAYLGQINAANTPYWAIMFGPASTTLTCSRSGAVRLTLEQVRGVGIGFNGGSNNPATGVTSNDNFVLHCHFLNSTAGEVNALSGGVRNLLVTGNTFRKLNSWAYEGSASPILFIGNLCDELDGSGIGIETVSTEYGWSQILGNQFIRCGNNNGEGVKPTIQIGETVANKVRVAQNVIWKAFGDAIVSYSGGTDIEVVDNTIDEYGVGLNVRLFDVQQNTGGYGIFINGGTRVKILRNTVRASTDADRYCTVGIGGQGTDYWSDGNHTFGSFSTNAQQYVTSYGIDGAGTRAFIGDNNWHNDGTKIVRIIGANASGALRIPVLTVNSTTPSVAGSRVWKTANTAGTSITTFGNPVLGESYTIQAGDANTTIVHDAAATPRMRLAGAANYVMGAEDTITLLYTLDSGGVASFVEIARSNN